jgi:tetratricopeptide (TPR) repeat protein
MRSDDRDPVDVLAEEFVDRLRRGEHPSVGDYAAAHPEHADALREVLPAVAQMEMLKRFRNPAPALPERLGDFHITRELGRGGMGIVFEAVQESLGRPVALKVLARHAQLDPKRRERFVREAQAAAKLHHTNIVPVFGVGEQDGLPYYVMQLIPGVGLHAVIREWRTRAGRAAPAGSETVPRTPDTGGRPEGPRPVAEPAVRTPDPGDWQFVARIGVEAADALHYAHRQGVLHRDVKPGNLIYDGQAAWVTDFGLAKMVNADDLTATGDILGTLQYLPPECLTGRADARSDVYGLGATLYELLTLEPPHSADSPARLIKLVADTDPRPPRELNPAVPRDLETIVLKALAREPRARYATAREMAEDLEAFLEDRPIRARRTSSVARAWRWCRRNPAIAALAFIALFAVSLAAATGWVGYVRTTAALAGEEDRRREAERAQRDAEQAKRDADRATALAQQKSEQLEKNLALSLRTFEQVFEVASGRPGFSAPMGGPGRGPGGWFGGPGHEHGPGGPKKDGPGHGGPKKDGPPGGPKKDDPGGPAAESASDKTAILEAVLNFYDQFAQQKAPDARIQFEAAKASRRMCEVYVWLQRPEKAVPAFARAEALLIPLLKDAPDNAEVRTELVMTYAAAPPSAFPNDRDAVVRRVVEVAAGDAHLTGTALFRIGFTREQSDDRVGAESAYREAVRVLSAVPRSPDQPPQPELGFARWRLGVMLMEQGKYAPARKVLEESVEDLRPFGDRGDGPSRPERELLGATYRVLADVCRWQKDDRAADQAEGNAARYGFGKKDGYGGKKDGPWGPGGKKDGPPPPPPKKG